MGPSVVSAEKSGATSPRRIAMCAPCVSFASRLTGRCHFSERFRIVAIIHWICRFSEQRDPKACETGDVSDSSAPVLAAFDLDGTLTEGGSVFEWLRFIAGRSTANRAAFALAFPLVIGAIRSGESADNAKERLFHSLLAGRDVTDV